MAVRQPVSIVSLDDYTEQAAAQALRAVLEPLGGLGFVRPGMTVAIKVNLIAGIEPEHAATTHPVLVAALCREIAERGARAVVGDSPGGMFTASHLQGVYRKSGLDPAVTAAGGELNMDFSVREVHAKNGVSLRTFPVTEWLLKADAIIDFAKLKTHAMLTMTGCVKNLFGAVPGTTKPELHMRYPELSAFANVMVDLNEFLKPTLYLCDGVEAMEGNGPTSGTRRHVGELFASRSAYDMDMVLADVIGLAREDVPTLEEAWKRGLGPESVQAVPIIGESKRIADFQTPSKRMKVTFSRDNLFGRITETVLGGIFEIRPTLKKSSCIGCGRCKEVCPAGAIRMRDIVKTETNKAGKLPEVNRRKCIHCFCCQEFCPVGAMRIGRTAVGSAIATVTGSAGKI